MSVADCCTPVYEVGSCSGIVLPVMSVISVCLLVCGLALAVLSVRSPCFTFLVRFVLLSDGGLLGSGVGYQVYRSGILLRGAILKRTYGTYKNLYISLFFLTIFGPIYYGPP